MLVTELLRANLYEFSRYNRESGDEPYFTLPRIRSIARQVRGPACTQTDTAAMQQREQQQHASTVLTWAPMQVLTSLSFMHSLGLVHADLKPENILVKSYSRCQVKVIDLGSSCYVTDHLSSYVQVRTGRGWGGVLWGWWVFRMQ